MVRATLPLSRQELIWKIRGVEERYRFLQAKRHHLLEQLQQTDTELARIPGYLDELREQLKTLPLDVKPVTKEWRASASADAGTSTGAKTNGGANAAIEIPDIDDLF